MTLLRKRSSKDVTAASPPQSKKTKSNAFHYAQLQAEVMMQVRRHHHQQQLSTLSSSRIRCRSTNQARSPTQELPNVQSSIITPCMPSPQQVLSQGQFDVSHMSSNRKATLSLSSMPSLPFETTRFQPAPTSAIQTPLEMLSSVSSSIANETFTKMSAATATTEEKKPQAKANIKEVSYIGDRNESGQRHGRGIMKYDNGCRYVGRFVNDKRHGFGKVWYPKGLGIYTGHWHKNKRCGEGTVSFANGDVYEGQWSMDMPNGLGKLTLTNGETYKGDFVNHHKQGRGVYKWPNGDIYEGKWMKDARNGAGLLTSADEDVCKQFYREGMLILWGKGSTSVQDVPSSSSSLFSRYMCFERGDIF